MEHEITSKEFTFLCKKHGFCKHNNVYSRCIGDGIFQNLSLAEKTYVANGNSTHIKTNSKSVYIKIGFWSMYADIPPWFFAERQHIGEFTPENLAGSRFCRSSFQGIQNEYRIMSDCGFTFLDNITTQRALLNATYLLNKTQYGILLPHQQYLCAPHYICGEYIEALNHLYALYAQSNLNFHSNYNILRDTGKAEEYLKKEIEFEKSIQTSTYFLKLLLGKNESQIKAYLYSCLESNIRLAKENGIIFSEGFSPCY